MKIRGYKKVLRLEVKTWSRDYWLELGRCISVDQFPDLKKKADVVIWSVTDADAIGDTPTPVKVLLVGWSTMDEIAKASIKFTGLNHMRKVENYQLDESDLHEIDSLIGTMP